MTANNDWHPADVVAALRKRGWSLRSLAKHHGYAPNTLMAVNQRPWPKGQRLVAEAIGVPPETIWPSRYSKHTNGRKKANVKKRRGV